ncbi:hypothetical protein CGRA01v4_11686 [Colletotrichum graminicola]|nr:hypothetical protein CGRA01v4_11686 [Colletotrichum graminicola]
MACRSTSTRSDYAAAGRGGEAQTHRGPSMADQQTEEAELVVSGHRKTKAQGGG